VSPRARRAPAQAGALAADKIPAAWSPADPRPTRRALGRVRPAARRDAGRSRTRDSRAL
jgi:hypothetical protein